jgi:hypothetical protein
MALKEALRIEKDYFYDGLVAVLVFITSLELINL